MAEVFVEAANYFREKKKIEENIRKTVRAIEDFYRPRIETVGKRYKDIMDEIDRRKLEDITVVNPLLYLTQWLEKCNSTILKSILQDVLREYKNTTSLINPLFILEDIEERVEKRKEERLEYIEKNMFSQIDAENFNFKKEMENLDQKLKEAERVAAEYGFKLEIGENSSKLITQINLNFSDYLEKLVKKGITVRNLRFENGTYEATLANNTTNLFVEYSEDKGYFIFYIFPTNEIEEYGKTIDLLLTTLKNLEEEMKENKKTEEMYNKNSGKKKRSKLDGLLNCLKFR